MVSRQARTGGRHITRKRRARGRHRTRQRRAAGRHRSRMTRTGGRPTFRQVMKGRGIKALIKGRGRAPISQRYTNSYSVNNPRYSQNRRYRTRDEIDRQRIRQEKRKLWEDIRNRQSQFYSSNKNTFHSLPIQGEEGRGAYKTYYYEKPLEMPIEVSLHKRHVEEQNVWDMEGVKTTVGLLKNVLTLALKIVDILKIPKAQENDKETT